MKEEIKTIFLLSSSHWDREWYMPFQGMRFRLADMMDELIRVLEEQPDFSLFCLDGQTIVLEDYIVAAPQNKERLQALISSGRLRVGPWYVMPDERLVSGESIIANFLKGKRVCARWDTEPWRFGYICDIFGHIAQMPQIMKGFGLQGAYLSRGIWSPWRGLFRWQGPDGSEIVSYLGQYGDFTKRMRKVVPNSEEWKVALREAVDAVAKNSSAPVLVLADAFDHAVIDPNTNRNLSEIKRLYPEAEVRHESLEQLAQAAAPYMDRLPIRKGELIDVSRNSKHSHRLVGQSISSYYPLKYRNDRCQNTLEKLAHPLTALARLCGYTDRPALMELCTDYLLKNQPHDSICGCSVDQVHIDMRYRYDQADEIAEEIVRRACEKLWQSKAAPSAQLAADPAAGNIANATAESANCLEIINPLPYTYRACIRAEIPFPRDYSARFSESGGYQKRNAFRLFDDCGRELPYQIHAVRENIKRRLEGTITESVDLYEISFRAELTAAAVNRIEIRSDILPVRQGKGDFAWGADYMDNGLVRVTVLPDGTLTLTDYATGKSYQGLNRYVDDGDAGDGWFRDEPIGDTLRVAGAPEKIEWLGNGPVCRTLRLTQKLTVPKKLYSTEETDISIVTEVTLWQGERTPRFEVTVHNTAADHRLRVLFPTASKADCWMSNQPFCFVSRPAGNHTCEADSQEMDTMEKSISGILYPQDKERSLAFVSPYGLHEGGMEEDGTLSVTLLRSFSHVYLAAEPKESRLLGTHHYSYALVPMDENNTSAELVRLQDEMALNLPIHRSGRMTKSDAPMLELEGSSLVYSILKTPEDGAENTLILRLWNASEKTQEGSVTTGFDLQEAFAVSLEETAPVSVPFTDRRIPLTVGPWQIVTLRLVKKSLSV